MPLGPLFTAIFLFSFLCYFLILKYYSQIPKVFLFFLLLLVIMVLLPLSPLFFSQDPVSYASYVKILLYYHLPPWFTPPSNFPADPWLPLNHWPTSASRYGPVWTFLSLFPYLLGQGQLVPVTYYFRLLGILGYIGNFFLIKKISSPKYAFLYALNPFIIIESVASPHVDVWMTTFILLSLFLIARHRVLSFLTFLFSLGVKIVSLPLFILYLLPKFPQSPRFPLYSALFLSYLGSAIIIAKWSINPWYLYLPISLTYLVWENRFWRNLALSFSVAATVRYLPYLYWGFFDPHNKIRAILFLVSLVPFVLWFLKEFRKYLLREISQPV